MEEVTRKLVGLLDVAPLGDDHFSGESDDLGFPNVFGGQVLGQGLMATSRTVEGRLAHSMHAYFLRPGNPHRGIDYEVQRVRDGGSFTVRRVIARQDEREILTAMVSFQASEEGFEHQLEAPSAPEPEGLTSEQALREQVRHLIPEERREQMMKERAIDIRPVDPTDPINPEPGDPYRQSWFRARGPLPDDPVLHRAILAYASDFGLLATSMRPHGVGFSTPGMQVASLDHAIWFHRPLQLDDWLLYNMDSPSASSGRGMNRGTLFNRAGELVASVAQEALVRQRS
ncbi:acyl-CoA thioesterase [Halomonadaceae bacterium KBTZ08]